MSRERKGIADERRRLAREREVYGRRIIGELQCCVNSLTSRLLPPTYIRKPELSHVGA